MSIFTRFTRAAKLARIGWEKPVPSDESVWTGAPWWGSRGPTGPIIDPFDQLSQNKSWVYICVNYNGRSVASQRLRLYTNKPKAATLRKDSTRPLDRDQKAWLFKNAGLDQWLTKAQTIEEVDSHLFLDLMRKINPLFNQFDMWWLTETYMGLTGDAYWYKRRGRLDKQPAELWTLESHRTTPKVGKTLDEYIKYFEYSTSTRDIPFKPEDVVYFKYPNPAAPYLGYSPVEGLTDSIRVNDEIYRYERAQFKNMARPDAVLEVGEEGLSDPEYKRLKKEWQATYGGASKAGQVAILEGGITYKPISWSPKELSHLEGRKSTREEIADGFGIPMALLSPEKVNLANGRMAYAQYMRDTVDPKLKMYEQKLNEQLLPDYEGGETLFCAFDNCIPEDMDSKLKQRETNLKYGVTIINEEREEDGRDQVEWGEIPIMPQTMIPLGSAPPPPPTPKATPVDLDLVAEAVAEEIYRRIA